MASQTRRGDGRPAEQAGERRPRPGRARGGQPGRPGHHRLRVVQGHEVVAERHRGDRVEPGGLERRRDAGRRALAEHELGGPVAGVDQQDPEADPREGAHRALPPGRAVVGDQRQHGHRRALDRQRDAHPDRPQEGEAGQLGGHEDRVAERLAGEDVADQRQHRDEHRHHRHEARDAHSGLRVELEDLGRAGEHPGEPIAGVRDGGSGRVDEGGHREGGPRLPARPRPGVEAGPRAAVASSASDHAALGQRGGRRRVAEAGLDLLDPRDEAGRRLVGRQLLDRGLAGRAQLGQLLGRGDRELDPLVAQRLRDVARLLEEVDREGPDLRPTSRRMSCCSSLSESNLSWLITRAVGNGQKLTLAVMKSATS